MTRPLAFVVFIVCAPFCTTPWQSAFAQDQFNNNTPGNVPTQTPGERVEENGWEYVADPDLPGNISDTFRWCKLSPASTLICLGPDEKPPYLQGRAEREPSPQAPDRPYNGNSPNGPTQSVSSGKPQRGKSGQGSGQPVRKALPRSTINAAISSYVLLAGATQETCQLKGTQQVGTASGFEMLYICLGPNHSDGQIISGDIQSADGNSRVYKKISGTFRAGPGGRQPTFEINYLNGIAPKGRIMTVSLR